MAGKSIKRGDRPTVRELTKFPGNDGPIDIPERITKDKKFCEELLEDDDGAKYNAIARKNSDIAERNSEALGRWIRGEGKKPCTYGVLIDVLRSSCKLNALANDIEAVVGAESSESSQHKKRDLPKRGGKPTLNELEAFVNSGRTFNIAQRIAVNYTTFGTALLEDSDGTKVATIVRKYSNDSTLINHEILTQWVQGMGMKPITWGVLIDVLRSPCNLNALAEDIEDVVGK